MSRGQLFDIALTSEQRSVVGCTKGDLRDSFFRNSLSWVSLDLHYNVSPAVVLKTVFWSVVLGIVLRDCSWHGMGIARLEGPNAQERHTGAANNGWSGDAEGAN